jgi:sugar phosphate permease
MSTMLLSGVTIVFMAFAGKSVAFVLFIALTGFFLYAMRAALQAWAVESTPREMAGSGVAIQFGIQSVGSAIAPAIFGMVADAYDLHAAFLVIAGTIVLANFLILFMPNGEARKPAAATA